MRSVRNRHEFVKSTAVRADANFVTRTLRLLIAVSLIVGTGLGSVTTAAAHSRPTPDSSTSAVASSTYTVRAGDSLVGIAHRFALRITDFLRVNSMTLNSVIRPGDVVVVSTTPPISGPVAPSTNPSTHVVRAGEAVASIASKYGVAVAALRSLNGLTKSSIIHPGQVLLLPVGSKPVGNATPIVPTPAPLSSPGGSTAVLVAYLRKQAGKPYKFFTAGPDTFDCSGLVVAGYRTIGIELPHQSKALSVLGVAVNWTSTPIQAGDLVFTASSSDPSQIGHVGVALDSSTWIQAVGTGQTVRIRALPSYARIIAVRRIPQP